MAIEHEDSIRRLVPLIQEAAAQLAKVAAAMADIAQTAEGAVRGEGSILERNVGGLPSINSRVYNALQLNGIRTIGQVLQHDRSFYLRLKNMGKGSVAHLEASLAKLDLELPALRRR